MKKIFGLWLKSRNGNRYLRSFHGRPGRMPSGSLSGGSLCGGVGGESRQIRDEARAAGNHQREPADLRRERHMRLL